MKDDRISIEWMIPSGYVKIAMENGPVEIVDLLIYPLKMVDLSIVFCMFTRG